jgi:hypothetical protein
VKSLVGLTIGDYTVLEELARGGFGVVYLARHPKIAKQAVVKQLHAEVVSEALAVSRIDDPGVVQIFNHGVLDDCSPFLLMEFLSGEPLEKRLAREGRLAALFAKEKSKAAKNRLVAQMASVVEKARTVLGHAIEAAQTTQGRLRGHGKVAWAKLGHLHRTMGTLLPQIRYWLRTGYVAANKVISLHIPELYSIVRGKVGKAVEFGLTWGITRLRGGFLLATLAKDKGEAYDSKFAVRAVKDHIARFGKAPRAYLCLRPWRLEWGEREGAAGSRRETRRLVAARSSPVGGLRAGEREAGFGASTSGGRDRVDKVRKVRVQQTGCAERSHYGRLWAACGTRLQPERADPRFGRAKGPGLDRVAGAVGRQRTLGGAATPATPPRRTRRAATASRCPNFRASCS